MTVQIQLVGAARSKFTDSTPTSWDLYRDQVATVPDAWWDAQPDNFKALFIALAGAGSGTTAPLALDRTNGTDTAIEIKRTADASPRCVIDADGKIAWDDGTDATPDAATLARSGSALEINGVLSVYSSGALASPTSGKTTLTFNGDTGGLLAVAGGAATKGLAIKGAAAQTANLQEWQNSAGTVLSSVDSAGRIGAGTSTPSTLGKLHVAGNMVIDSDGIIYWGTSGTAFIKGKNGAAGYLQLACNGSIVMQLEPSEIGFFGATPVAQQTAPAAASGTDAAIIDAIVTALTNLGLMA